MFVGLFLFTPFLNYLYKNIPNEHKWLFIITLFLVFSSPQITTYWTVAYPIMYYFLGCFLRDKQFKVKKSLLVLLIASTALLQTFIAKYKIPIYGTENHNNIGCAILSVCIFLLFYDLKTQLSASKKSGGIKLLRTVANASLATFLISQIFETLTKNYFAKLQLTNFDQKLPYLLYITPIKFVASVICGIIICFIATKLFKLINTLITKAINAKKGVS